MKHFLTAIGSFFSNPNPKSLIFLWTVPIIFGAIPTYIVTWTHIKPTNELFRLTLDSTIRMCLYTMLLVVVATIAKFVTLLCRRSPGSAFLNLLAGALMFIGGFVVFALISRFFWEF